MLRIDGIVRIDTIVRRTIVRIMAMDGIIGRPQREVQDG